MAEPLSLSQSDMVGVRGEHELGSASTMGPAEKDEVLSWGPQGRRVPKGKEAFREKSEPGCEQRGEEPNKTGELEI